jgi:hypothetical protein
MMGEQMLLMVTAGGANVLKKIAVVGECRSGSQRREVTECHVTR